MQKTLETVVAKKAVPGQIEQMRISIGHILPEKVEFVLDIADGRNMVRKAMDEEIEPLAETFEITKKLVVDMLRRKRDPVGIDGPEEPDVVPDVLSLVGVVELSVFAV